jgi:hypothetical protein
MLAFLISSFLLRIADVRNILIESLNHQDHESTGLVSVLKFNFLRNSSSLRIGSHA